MAQALQRGSIPHGMEPDFHEAAAERASVRALMRPPDKVVRTHVRLPR